LAVIVILPPEPTTEATLRVNSMLAGVFPGEIAPPFVIEKFEIEKEITPELTCHPS
jgi:hypothetical protein